METLISTAAIPPKKIAVPGETWEGYRNCLSEPGYRHVTRPTSTRTYHWMHEEPDTSLGAEDPARLETGVVYMQFNDMLLPVPITSADEPWIVWHDAWPSHGWLPEEMSEEPADASTYGPLPDLSDPVSEMHDMAAHFAGLLARLWSRHHDTSGSPQGNLFWTAVPHIVRKNEESSPNAPNSVGPSSDDDLHAALYDLWCAREEAIEEGFPVPSESALANANRLLKEIYGICRRRFEVYPTQDGNVAIDAPGGQGRSVLLLCDSQGGALCMVNMHGNHRRARYATTEMLPDGFIRDALAELEYRDGWQL